MLPLCHFHINGLNSWWGGGGEGYQQQGLRSGKLCILFCSRLLFTTDADRKNGSPDVDDKVALALLALAHLKELLRGVDLGVDRDKGHHEADHPYGNDDQYDDLAAKVLVVGLGGADDLEPPDGLEFILKTEKGRGCKIWYK